MELGAQVGHYKLAEVLGEGAFGVVYRGVHQADADLQTAIKVMRRQLVGDAQFLETLKRECRHLDRMDHPGIVRFRDLVIADGDVAVVMELLEGRDLGELLAERGALPAKEAHAIIAGVLEALSYAHGRGVMHRDLKPSNVFMCDDGRIKILDFGLAKAAGASQASQTGTLRGTPQYIAPERFGAGEEGPHADLYAVGLIAWELCVGQPACPPGDLWKMMGWHLGVGASDPRTKVPGLNADLAECIGRMCEKDPANRPSGAHEALEGWRALTGLAAAVVAPSSPTRDPAKRPPRTVSVDRVRVESPPEPQVEAPRRPTTRTERPSTVSLPRVISKPEVEVEVEVEIEAAPEEAPAPPDKSVKRRRKVKTEDAVAQAKPSAPPRPTN